MGASNLRSKGDIRRYTHRMEDRGSWLETRDRTQHRLGDLLALNHAEIAAGLRDLHPHIEYDCR